MTLRAGSSAVVFVVIAAIVTLLFADALLRGAWAIAARTGGIGALVVWAAWLLLVRPSIRVRPDRAVVVNVGRITEVPWPHVVEIRRRLQLILDLDDGRSVEAWGSPFVSRRPRGGKPVPDSALDALRSAWTSGPVSTSGTGSTAVVERRPDTVALLVGAGTVVLAVLGTLGAGVLP